MAESGTNSTGNTPKYYAPKDKACPYCGQVFTSSSLGRHLDLYIKEKNPKPPDGIHDIEEIRRIRANITRRQPRSRTSLGRAVSTPTGTPRPGLKRDSFRDSDACQTPTLPREGQYVVDSRLSRFPLTPGWDQPTSNGVGPARTPEFSQGQHGPAADGVQDSTSQRPGMSRQVSRQVMQKAQLDAKHRLADAMDTARAAELALREVLGSWRAARYEHVAAIPGLCPC